LEEFFQNELTEFYQVESPSFNMNFKNIIFSEVSSSKEPNQKESENHNNNHIQKQSNFMQKHSKLLLQNKEVKSKYFILYFYNLSLTNY